MLGLIVLSSRYPPSTTRYMCSRQIATETECIEQIKENSILLSNVWCWWGWKSGTVSFLYRYAVLDSLFHSIALHSHGFWCESCSMQQPQQRSIMGTVMNPRTRCQEAIHCFGYFQMCSRSRFGRSHLTRAVVSAPKEQIQIYTIILDIRDERTFARLMLALFERLSRSKSQEISEIIARISSLRLSRCQRNTPLKINISFFKKKNMKNMRFFRLGTTMTGVVKTWPSSAIIDWNESTFRAGIDDVIWDP